VHDIIVRPLGGCGEVGLNATLIEDEGDQILIDCGIGLGLADAPGIERLIPDFSLLSRPGKTLRAVILTHGHEDHIGALPDLFIEHDVPVYGPPLAILFARSRLERRGMPFDHLVSIPIGGRLTVGPFEIEWVRVTHSIPDAAALVIDTRGGRIFHSGDFKIDRHPVDGHTTDVPRLLVIGESGVDLMLSDSTNSEVPGRTRSETDVGVELERIAIEAEGRLVVACFASHMHRLQSLARAAKASGRRLQLFGNALHRGWTIGTRAGHLSVEADLVEDVEKIAKRPGLDTLVVVTGAQGEPRAALGRIALEHALPLGPADRVVLSTSTIPGNEKNVRRVMNALAITGCQVIDDGLRPVHCSGHAHQDEQAELIALVRPKCFVPIHGDRAMLEAHARTARHGGVPRALVIEDGESIVLARGESLRGDVVPMSPRPIDSGERIIEWVDVDARRHIAFSGLVTCAVALSPGDRLAARPVIAMVGLPKSPLLAVRLVELAAAAIDGRIGEDLAERIRVAIKREVKRSVGSRPVVEIQIIRLTVGPDRTSLAQRSREPAEKD